MPAVIDTPELIEHSAHVETHSLIIERFPAHSTRPGFWRTLMRRVATYLTPKRREQHAQACYAHRAYEAPMDQFIREYPLISVYALAVI